VQYTLTTYNPAKTYKASASLEVDAFSLILFDEEGELHTYFHQIPYDSEHINEISEELDVKNVKQRQAVLWCEAAALIPAEGFEDNTGASYLKRIRYVKESEQIVSRRSGDIQILWSYDRDMISQNSFLAGFQLEHPQVSLLENLSENDFGIHASISGDNLVLIHYSDKGLQLCNQYEVQTSEDLVYYVLTAYKQAGLDPLKDALYISGNVSEEGSLIRYLRQFVAHFQWEGPDKLHFKRDFLYPKHLFTYYKL
jgi:hypothetical protein